MIGCKLAVCCRFHGPPSRRIWLRILGPAVAVGLGRKWRNFWGESTCICRRVRRSSQAGSHSRSQNQSIVGIQAHSCTTNHSHRIELGMRSHLGCKSYDKLRCLAQGWCLCMPSMSCRKYRSIFSIVGSTLHMFGADTGKSNQGMCLSIGHCSRIVLIDKRSSISCRRCQWNTHRRVHWSSEGSGQGRYRLIWWRLPAWDWAIWYHT